MAKKGSDHSRQQIHDTLRLTAQTESQLMNQLNSTATQSVGANRRLGSRVSFQTNQGLPIKIKHPGGTGGVYLVRPRNLSKSGMAFLHGAYIHNGTRCVIPLLVPGSKPITISAAVVRCSHIRGNVHDIGVRFDTSVDITKIVTPAGDKSAGPKKKNNAAPSAPTETPKVQFQGNVLYVDNIIEDRELLSFMMQSNGVDMLTAGSVDEAMRLVHTAKFDVILCEINQVDAEGNALPKLVRDLDFTGSIIAVTANESSEAEIGALEQGFTGLLHKPFDRDVVMNLLASHLEEAKQNELPDEEPLYSQMWSNPDIRPLIITYLARLETKVNELTQACDAGKDMDLDHLRKQLFEVKGSAGGYGFPTISEGAKEALIRLEEKSGSDAVIESVRSVIDLCKTACLVPH